MLNKAQELKQLSQFMFSVSRRRKARLLAREWLSGLPHVFRSGTASGTDFPPDPEPQVWHSHQTTAFDKAFFDQTSATLVEDCLGDDGLVHTKHDYVVQTLYGAISYTNGSTHRSLFNRDGERLYSFSYTRPGARKPSQLRLPVTRLVKGKTANLYGNVAAAEGNYFHWFVDALARFFLIEKFHSPDSIDYVLVPPLKYDFHWDSLAALGFDRSRIIEMQPLDCLQFECLVTSTPPRGKGSTVCPVWAIERYNDLLVGSSANDESLTDEAEGAGKRIYVSRRDAPNRMFVNEEAVCEFLEKRGFTIVELTPLNLHEKIAVFRNADVIVSQTGAGLTNVMFCRRHTKVLELVNTRFIYPLYASMAAHRGAVHRVHYFSNDTALGRMNAIMAKSSIDIDELDQALVEFGI